MRYDALVDAFARAIADPSRPPPADTRGRDDRPAGKRFAVYRNNVAVGLLKSLEARYPVTRRLVGDDFFRGMAGAYLQANKPRTPVMIRYGANFPSFVAGFAPARDLAYLADVARLENAWVETYHAAEAPALAASALAETPTERLPALVFVLHPAVRLLRFAYPAASIWAAHQGGAEPRAPERWAGEDVLITRPGADVLVRILPEGGYAFVAALLGGVPLGEAAGALAEAGHEPGAQIVGLFEAGAVCALR